MNKKQIINIIQSNIESHIPATAPRISWDTIESVHPYRSDAVISRQRKPFLVEIRMVFATLIVIALVIFGINYFSQPSEVPLQNPYQIQSNQVPLSISAVSTASIVSNLQAAPISYTAAVSYIQTLSTAQSTTALEPYLEMIETITGQNANIGIDNVASDNPSYAFQTKLTTLDLLGNSIVFNLYYNTVSYTQHNQKDSYVIEGIFLYNDQIFDFSGSQTWNNDEETLYFKTTSDASNYVESTLTSQNNESQYHLKIVQNGSIASESKFHIEENNNEKAVHLEYTNGADRGTYEIKYELENSMNVLKVEYQTLINGVSEAGQMKISVTVDPTTGMSSYQILVKPNDEQEYEYSKERKIHEKDASDEHDSTDSSTTNDSGSSSNDSGDSGDSEDTPD